MTPQPDDARSWLREYFRRYERTLFGADVAPRITTLAGLLLEVRDRGGRVFLAGNGASASIASHAAVDLVKTAGIPAHDFNEPNLITALANDHGYEQWIARALELRSSPGDAAVLISSSGRSPNIIAAARRARELGLRVVAFSGFAPDNPLRALADVEFHVDSSEYNIVECTHMIWLMATVDLLARPSVSPSG
jgi:D-sedoheptulose 7-phosphate isomerase